MPNKSHGIHLTRGTLQGTLAMAMGLPAAIVTAAILSRKLGPVDYGLLSVASGIIIWVESAITMGLNRTAIKFTAQAHDWQGTATRFIQVQLAICLVCTLLLWFWAPALAALSNSPALVDHLRLFAWGLPLICLSSLHESFLIGRGMFGFRARLTLVFWFSRMGFVLLLVGSHPRVWAAITALVLPYLVTLSMARCRVAPPFTGTSPLPLKALGRFALPVFGYALALRFFSRMDLFFVKALAPAPETAGHYGAAQNLTLVPAMFMTTIVPLLLSKLSRIGTRDPRAAGHLTTNALRFLVCLLPFAAMTAGCAPQLIQLIYGPLYAPAAPLLGLLIFSSLGVSVIIILAYALVAAHRPQIPLYLMGPGLVLGALGLGLWVPVKGAMGAAQVSLVTSWLGAAAFMAALARIWPLPLPWPTLIRSLLVSAGAYALSVGLPSPGPWVLLKLAGICAAIPLALVVTGELNPVEQDFFKTVLGLGPRTSQRKTP